MIFTLAVRAFDRNSTRSLLLIFELSNLSTFRKKLPETRLNGQRSNGKPSDLETRGSSVTVIKILALKGLRRIIEQR